MSSTAPPQDGAASTNHTIASPLQPLQLPRTGFARSTSENTCFLNAGVMLLICTTKLQRALRYPSPGEHTNLVYDALVRDVRNLFASTTGEPPKLAETIATLPLVSGQIDISRQQDAHELLLLLLNLLPEENTLRTSVKVSERKCGECIDCGQASLFGQDVDWNYISLPLSTDEFIPSIGMRLARMAEKEKVIRECPFKLSGGCLSDRAFTSSTYGISSTLLVQLPLYKFDPETEITSKGSTYEMVIDEVIVHGGKRLRLKCVLTHEGSLTSGHYFTFAIASDKSVVCYNDGNQPKTYPNLETAFLQTGLSDPFMLAYELEDLPFLSVPLSIATSNDNPQATSTAKPSRIPQSQPPLSLPNPSNLVSKHPIVGVAASSSNQTSQKGRRKSSSGGRLAAKSKSEGKSKAVGGMSYEDTFVNGSTLRIAVVEFNDQLKKLFDLCHYYTTTMGENVDLEIGNLYYFISHRPEKVAEIMSDTSVAFKLWTNSLTTMDVTKGHRGLYNNFDDMFDNFEKDVGMIGSLSDRQRLFFEKSVGEGRKRDPPTFEQEVAWTNSLSAFHQKAMLALLNAYKDTSFDYSSPNWVGRSALEKLALDVGEHNLEFNELYAIFQNAASNARTEQRKQILTYLESDSFPSDEAAWKKLATDDYTQQSKEDGSGEEDGGDDDNEDTREREEEKFGFEEEDEEGWLSPASGSNGTPAEDNDEEESEDEARPLKRARTATTRNLRSRK